MKQLFWFLLFVQCYTLKAQESYMKWLNGRNHCKGVFVFEQKKELTQKKPFDSYPKFSNVIINDTFWFRNFGKDTITINKIHTADTSGITFSKKTAPNEIGFVAIKRVRQFKYSELLFHEKNYFNVMTNYTPWEFCTLDYILVTPVNKIVTWNLEERSYTQTIDSLKSLKLYLNEQGFPLKMGMESRDKKEKLMTWKYWKDGEYIGDTIHLKRVTILIQSSAIGKWRKLRCEVYKHQQWEAANANLNDYLFEMYIDSKCDSFKLYNDSEYTQLPLSYSTMSEMTHYQYLNFMKFNSDYYATKYNVYPIEYINRTFVLILKDTSKNEEILNKLRWHYNGFVFVPYTGGHIFCVIPDEISEDRQRQMIFEIASEVGILYASQLFKEQGSLSYFYDNFSAQKMNFSTDVKPLIEQYNFSLKEDDKMSYFSEYTYNGKVLDREFLVNFRSLCIALGFTNQIPQKFIHRVHYKMWDD